MRYIALTILMLATECNAQVQIFRAATQRPSAAVDVTPRAPNSGTTPAADTSELKIIRGEVIKSDGYTLVFCTANWCGPCRSFKASNEYARIRERVSIEIADIDKYPAWRRYARRVPTFWLIRKSDRARLKSWEGAISLTQIEAEIRVQTLPKATAQAMKHSDLIQMHNRLHGGGQWTWPGDLRTHLRTVHGVAL